MNDDALTYLQGDSQGPKRDLIAKYYYEVAQGDPKSAPVSFAILLDTAAQRFADTPKELLSLLIDLRKLVDRAREMEAGIRERVELSNAGVVAEFKDETRRAQETWLETFRYAKETTERAQEIIQALTPDILEVRALAREIRQLNRDLATLREDLKIHDESHQKTVESAAKIVTSHQSIQELVKHLTKQARFNWVTIGFLGGLIFAGSANQFQTDPWQGLVAFGLGIGLIQWVFRKSWNFIRAKVSTLMPPAKPK